MFKKENKVLMMILPFTLISLVSGKLFPIEYRVPLGVSFEFKFKNCLKHTHQLFLFLSFSILFQSLYFKRVKYHRLVIYGQNLWCNIVPRFSIQSTVTVSK